MQSITLANPLNMKSPTEAKLMHSFRHNYGIRKTRQLITGERELVEVGLTEASKNDDMFRNSEYDVVEIMNSQIPTIVTEENS